MPYFVVLLAVLLADQASKLLIVDRFMLFESQSIIPGVFNLTHVVNTGAAFSLLAEAQAWWRQPFFLAVGVVAVTVVTVLALRLRREAPRLTLSLALIAGGALGNLVDRIRLGGVIDFLDFHWAGYHWPAFNLADSAICVGVGSYILFSLKGRNGNEQPEEKQ